MSRIPCHSSLRLHNTDALSCFNTVPTFGYEQTVAKLPALIKGEKVRLWLCNCLCRRAQQEAEQEWERHGHV